MNDVPSSQAVSRGLDELDQRSGSHPQTRSTSEAGAILQERSTVEPEVR